MPKNNEHTTTRVAAQKYAIRFLTAKYQDEYRELYQAYLINRGVPVREANPLIDERDLING